MMTPTLEAKLAQIVNYLEERKLGSGAHARTADSVGLKHLLNDAEVMNWLDAKRKEGIGNGPFLNRSGS